MWSNFQQSPVQTIRFLWMYIIISCRVRLRNYCRIVSNYCHYNIQWLLRWIGLRDEEKDNDDDDDDNNNNINNSSDRIGLKNIPVPMQQQQQRRRRRILKRI
jgi:hypothetical protein